MFLITYIMRFISGICLTLWRPAAFGDFWKKKTPKRTWLCAGISQSGMLYRPGKSLKRCGKSSSLHLKKFFCLGVQVFVSDVINGGLLGHLGPLCLALGANH